MAKVIVNGDIYDGVTEVRLQKSDSAGNVTGEQSFYDTLDANASTSDILSGKTAYSNGSKISGGISSKTAETYTPGRTDQTISAGQYLSGVQTIKGDNNLIAANIADGVRIFNVLGTYGGSAQPTQVKTVTGMSFSGGATTYEVYPNTGYVMSKVIIDKDSNLIASNIAENTTIYGITGTHSGGKITLKWWGSEENE